MRLYVHLPFCAKKCTYCDFTTRPLRGAEMSDYVAALHAEMVAVFGLFAERPRIDSVFFGGGTPTLHPVSDIASVLAGISHLADMETDCEITVEANPDDITPEKVQGLLATGVNRLSLGVQTTNDQLLALIGRVHQSSHVLRALEILTPQFENLSIDFIVGLPGQSDADIIADLALLQRFPVAHVSLYVLELHKGTMIKFQKDQLPDSDRVAAWYELAVESLRAIGLYQYEISNFARPGAESRHNQGYWRYEPYVGLGVSAASFYPPLQWGEAKLGARSTGFCRTRNTLRAKAYMMEAKAGLLPLDFVEFLSPEQARFEWTFLRLRTSAGLSTKDFAGCFGMGWLDLYGESARRLEEQGLLVFTEISAGDTCIALTRRGQLISNHVFSELWGG